MFEETPIEELEMVDFLKELYEEDCNNVSTVPFGKVKNLEPIPLDQDEIRVRSNRINGKRKILPSLFKNGDGEKNIG